MRTQKDRDEDLALGRELERKDAEIDRLRADRETYNSWALEIKVNIDVMRQENALLRAVAIEARDFIAGMVKPAAPGIHTISSYHPCYALVDKINAALGDQRSTAEKP